MLALVQYRRCKRMRVLCVAMAKGEIQFCIINHAEYARTRTPSSSRAGGPAGRRVQRGHKRMCSAVRCFAAKAHKPPPPLPTDEIHTYINVCAPVPPATARQLASKIPPTTHTFSGVCHQFATRALPNRCCKNFVQRSYGYECSFTFHEFCAPARQERACARASRTFHGLPNCWRRASASAHTTF